MDAADLRDHRLDDLRDRIALVAQDTYLFNDTLRTNILIGNPDATDDELGAAVEHASLAELVQQLPDGLDTEVGERGTSLSGGQRQRVAIARAFLKDAPVLILDEATSHLDAVNELAVRQSLDQLQSDRTTIVIAHRLSTIRDADQIVVLDEGRVVETGTHDDLLAATGCMPSWFPPVGRRFGWRSGADGLASPHGERTRRRAVARRHCAGRPDPHGRRRCG